MYWALFGRAGSTNSWMSSLENIWKYTNSGWCNKIDDIYTYIYITEIETVSISKLHNYIHILYVWVYFCVPASALHSILLIPCAPLV